MLVSDVPHSDLILTLQNDHHDKSSNILSLHKVSIILTIFLMLYAIYWWLIYFKIGSLYLLICFTYVPNLHLLPFDSHPFFLLYLWVCFYFVLFFWLPHLSEIIRYLSFCIWLIPLNILPSRSICDVTNDRLPFLGLGNIPLCVYTQTPHLLYP